MTILTTQERALLQARLTEAESAYHKLMIGGQAKVFVDQNGERIEYQASTVRGLSAYINSLKSQLGVGVSTGPLNVWLS